MDSEAPISILIIDAEPGILRTLASYLKMRGFPSHAVESTEDALSWLSSNTAHILLWDMDADGTRIPLVMEALRAKGGFPQVIAMSADPVVDRVADAFLAGAGDFLFKPFESLDEVGRAVARAVERLLRWKQLLAYALSEEGLR